jgi:hypothetical protein
MEKHWIISNDFDYLVNWFIKTKNIYNSTKYFLEFAEKDFFI